MKTENLIELAEKILEVNPKCALSGSLGLHLQGIKTRRTPNDLDIYLPYDDKFTPIQGMYRIGDNGEGYPEENWDRTSYMIDKTKIDVFTPEHDSVCALNIVQNQGILCVEFPDIIKFKIQHSFGNHWTRYKHKDDISYMLLMNGI